MVGWTTFVAGQGETSLISSIVQVLPAQAIFGQVILWQAIPPGVAYPESKGECWCVDAGVSRQTSKGD